ncbi:hypothetical protein Bca101_024566 [Brassica carinata]
MHWIAYRDEKCSFVVSITQMKHSRTYAFDQATRNIEVWVSSKLGDGDVSFTKYFSLSGSVLPALWVDADAASPVYCFVKPKSVIVWCVGVEREGHKVCTCLTNYEINEGGMRNRTVTKRYTVHDFSRAFVCGYMHVPSMILFHDAENASLKRKSGQEPTLCSASRN